MYGVRPLESLRPNYLRFYSPHVPAGVKSKSSLGLCLRGLLRRPETLPCECGWDAALQGGGGLDRLQVLNQMFYGASHYMYCRSVDNNASGILTGNRVVRFRATDSNAALDCGMGGPANRTPAKNCDLACGEEPGLDLALNRG